MLNHKRSRKEKICRLGLWVVLLLGTIILMNNAYGASANEIQQGLVGYWNMSSNIEIFGKYNLSNVGNVQDYTGKIGGAKLYQYTGRSDIGNSFDIETDEDFTMNAWVYFKPTGNMYCLGQYKAGGQETFTLVTNPSNNYIAGQIIDTSSNNYRANYTPYIENSWQMVTMLYNASTKNWRFYYNGTISNSINLSNNPRNPAGSNWIMGMAEGTNPVNVSIDEVGIWNRSLSDDEISSLYNGGFGNSYPFGSNMSIVAKDKKNTYKDLNYFYVYLNNTLYESESAWLFDLPDRFRENDYKNLNWDIIVGKYGYENVTINNYNFSLSGGLTANLTYYPRVLLYDEFTLLPINVTNWNLSFNGTEVTDYYDDYKFIKSFGNMTINISSNYFHKNLGFNTITLNRTFKNYTPYDYNNRAFYEFKNTIVNYEYKNVTLKFRNLTRSPNFYRQYIETDVPNNYSYSTNISGFNNWFMDIEIQEGNYSNKYIYPAVCRYSIRGNYEQTFSNQYNYSCYVPPITINITATDTDTNKLIPYINATLVSETTGETIFAFINQSSSANNSISRHINPSYNNCYYRFSNNATLLNPAVNYDVYNVTLTATGYQEINFLVNVTEAGAEYHYNLSNALGVRFWFYDEQNLTTLNNVSISISNNDIQFGENKTADSGNNINLTEAGEYIIIYSKSGYPERHYYFSIQEKENKQFNLYLLRNISADLIKYNLKDIYGLTLNDYLIDIYRYYPAINGSYILINSEKTGVGGNAYMNLEKNNAFYKIYARSSINNPPILVQNPQKIYVDEFNLIYDDTSADSDSWTTYYDLVYNLSYINMSDNLTYSLMFQDLTGGVTKACLEVWETSGSDYGKIKEVCLEASAGNIFSSINTTQYPKTKARAIIYTDSQYSSYIIEVIEYITDLTRTLFGGFSLWIAFLIIATTFLVGLSVSGIAGLIGLFVGIVISSILGFYLVSGTILVLMIILIIWIILKRK